MMPATIASVEVTIEKDNPKNIQKNLSCFPHKTGFRLNSTKAQARKITINVVRNTAISFMLGSPVAACGILCCKERQIIYLPVGVGFSPCLECCIYYILTAHDRLLSLALQPVE